VSQLLDLAERCEKATGPDRELDLEIAIAVWGRPGVLVMRHDPETNTNREYTHWDFTASIDAAMTLVPEGWFFSGLDQCSPSVQVWTEGNKARYSPQLDGLHAATPALALCAASLRARATP
jgi:hypothetical protein